MYGTVAPLATYSPWVGPFSETFASVKDHTLVDMYRCHELCRLVEQSAKLPYGALLEVGVWRGGTGALIAISAENAGIEDTVYLADTFKGVVKSGEMDTHYRNGEHADTSAEQVLALMDSLSVKNVSILTGVFPEDSGCLVEAEAFRFAHIDVDVYESARDATEWLWPRLVPGGIVVYDDYGFVGCPGVTYYVNEQRSESDRLVFHNLNGQAVVVKLPSLTGHTA